MTPAELSVLAAEIKSDPLGLGYAAHLPFDPVRVVELLTVETETKLGPLRSTTAKAWAARGPYAKIVDASNLSTHPCRASCLVIRDSFACGDMIHVEDADLQGMLDAWISNDIATQAEVDALYKLAMQAASRADVLGIPAPTARDIIDAWSIE
jgi:hypothetical protein